VLSRWRKREAKARNVDLQVVMPGHCMDPLVSALATSRDEPRARLAQRLTAIEGICGGRLERYTDALHELAQQGERDAPPTADPQTDGAAG
jgi:ribonuclease D